MRRPVGYCLRVLILNFDGREVPYELDGVALAYIGLYRDGA